MVGRCNRVAHAACLSICDTGDSDSASDYNPLVLHGEHGTGKTHLLHATSGRLLATSKRRVVYETCEQFTNRFLSALESNQLASFRTSYREADVIVMDDISFLAGKEKSQEEFFHILRDLVESEAQVVLSAQRSPHAASALHSRLVSLLQSGLVVRMDPPDLETRIEILVSKANSRGRTLSTEVARMVASTVGSDLRELEGTLSRVLNASSSTGLPLTVETVRGLLHELTDSPVQSSAVTVPQILRAVQDYFHLSRRELLSRSKVRSLVYARQTGMYLARELTPLSLEEIGKRFGDRDHTTVLYALNRIAAMKNGRPEVKATLRNIRHCIDYQRNS